MSKEELDTKLKELATYYQSAVANINKEFAMANNPYKIGDTITDHQYSIVIDSIKYVSYASLYVPSMVYEGFIALKSGGIGKKRGVIYQQNIK